MHGIWAKAPGSLMLMGEHAVLHGAHAIVGAINKFITVNLYPHDDQIMRVASIRGGYESDIADLKPSNRLSFIVAAAKHFQPHFKQGFALHIDNEFDSRFGLGSSAAVLVATVKAFCQWLQFDVTPQDLWQHCYDILLSVQEQGSGADLAASILGGVVQFRSPIENNTVLMTRLTDQLPLTVVYAGYKTPTVTVIKEIQRLWQKKPRQLKLLFQQTEQLTTQALPLIKQHELSALGELFTQQYKIQKAMGMSDDKMDSMVHYLNKLPGIFGSKISGSGRGDCVIGLGETGDPGALDRLIVSLGDEGVSSGQS